MNLESQNIDHLRNLLVKKGRISASDWVFNPSFVFVGNQEVIATFRLFRKSTRKKTQVVARVQVVDSRVADVTIERELESLGGFTVKDMKLFRFNREVYATWNTGHPESSVKTNSILVASLRDLDNPREVILHGRHRIEKNWGFFVSEGRLRAIYSLVPLVFLEEDETGSSAEEILMKVSPSSGTELSRPLLSIGSQPQLHKGKLFLTAHRKPSVFKFRAYIPYLVILDLRVSRLRIERIRLPRGTFSFAPSKLNKLAFAVNYSSGLAILHSQIIVGIGQADSRIRVFKGRLPD